MRGARKKNRSSSSARSAPRVVISESSERAKASSACSYCVLEWIICWYPRILERTKDEDDLQWARACENGGGEEGDVD